MEKHNYDCDAIRALLSPYLVQETGEQENQAIEAHLQVCESCRQELEQLKALQQACKTMELEELPSYYAEEFQEKLAQESHGKKSRHRAGKHWGLLAACACLLLVVGISGSSLLLGSLRMGSSGAAAESASYNNAAADQAAPAESGSTKNFSLMVMQDSDTEEMVETEGAEQLDDGTSAVEYERKIIRNYSLDLKVEDFDAAYDQICQLAEEYGGYVSSGDVYDYEGSTYRDGYLAIRVDSDRVEEAIAAISELGFLEGNRYSSEDITTEYYDTQSRLEVYEAQRDRLLELYAQANSVEEMLSIESQLANTVANIESLEGMMQYYDQLTSLSLIEINLYTPSNYEQSVEPKGWAGFTQKISENLFRGANNLLDNLASLLYAFVRALPTLLLLAAVVVVIVLVIRRIRRNKQK